MVTDFNCFPGDFDSAGFVFCEAKENPGRRPFPRGERHFEMVTMGGAASSNIESQRVAHRAGFKPAWICAYRGRFDNMLTSLTG